MDINALVPNDKKIAVLQGQIDAFALDYWQNSLNLDAAVASGDTEAQTQAQANMDSLSASIADLQARLAQIPTN